MVLTILQKILLIGLKLNCKEKIEEMLWVKKGKWEGKGKKSFVGKCLEIEFFTGSVIMK